jgi:hypothetical protein
MAPVEPRLKENVVSSSFVTQSDGQVCELSAGPHTASPHLLVGNCVGNEVTGDEEGTFVGFVVGTFVGIFVGFLVGFLVN